MRTGIPLHGIEATDKIWKTCCALHNFLFTPLPTVPEPEVENEVPGPIQVRKMDLPTFKSKLINHFDIMWKRGLLEWPSRNGTNPPPLQIIEHQRSDE